MKQIQWLTNYYIYGNPSIKQLIDLQQGKSVDTQVRNAFNLISKYFEFLLPKYFTAFENIFNFVYHEGEDKVLNLKLLVTKLEFGFLGAHEITLKEAGLPNSIIRKVSARFEGCESLDQINARITKNSDVLSDLNSFEKRIFRKYI